MKRLIWITPILGFLLASFSLSTGVHTPNALNPTGTATTQITQETPVGSTPAQPETPVSSKPGMDGTWDLHITWNCFPPAYTLEGVFSAGHIQITDKRGGKFPEGLYMVRNDTSDLGNLQMDTFRNPGEKTDDYIFSPTMTPIFIYNFSFIGTVNDERTQIKDGKFDIINNKGEATSGCWEAERKDSITPTVMPTAVPLPDPSGVIKEFGFTVYSNDITCVDWACKAFSKSGTGLILKTYSDGSMFSLMLNRDPGISIGWVKKVLTALYPDMADEIVKAIPTKGTSGQSVAGQGSNGYYNWTVMGIWGLAIEVNIVPVGIISTPDLPTPTSIATETPPAAAEKGIPVIQSVNLRRDTSTGELVIYQDISFIDDEGDVNRVDYEIIATTMPGLQVEGGSIDTPEMEQKAGSVITGEWGCGSDKYSVTIQATLTDNAGNHSEPYDYTMVCDAGN